MKKVIIAGGTGFLGQEIKHHYESQGCEVYILTRKPSHKNDIYWDGKTIGKWFEYLDGADILINLSGKSVDCRYTPENKKKILNSRIWSTQILQQAVNECSHPPKTWMNASTATIYADSRTHQNTEENGIIGSDFSMNVAKEWEETFFKISSPLTRKVALRISLVIGKSGGVYPVLVRLAKWGLGGRAGNGTQKFAYIKIEELLNMLDFIEANEKLKGPVNCTSPEDLTNSDFMRLLRKENKIRYFLHQPEWMIKLGAKLIGTAPELILKSRYVYPEKLTQAGYTFKYPTYEQA